MPYPDDQLTLAQVNASNLPTLVAPRAQAARINNSAAGDFTSITGADGKEVMVISAAAPVNADGRPNGTVYIQTA